MHEVEKNVYDVFGNDEKKSITVLITVSASGIIVPATIVYPWQRLNQNIALSIPKDWGIAKSNYSWTTGEVFFEYMANVFRMWLIKNKIRLPIIMIMTLM